MPLERSGPLLIGTSTECDIRISAGGSASRLHARLERTNEGWSVTDLRSKNGTRQDGEDRLSFVLAPGMELELGRARLIAESPLSIVLHELLRRLIGWGADKLEDVDRALQAVRQMAHMRASLVVLGDGSMIGTARRIHALVLGNGRPFSAHTKKESGAAAVDRARDGIVLFDADDLPTDFGPAVVTSRLPDWRGRLVIRAAKAKGALRIAARVPALMTITVPSIAKRRDEVDQLLLAYADDAVAALKAPGRGLRPQDLQWIRAGGVTDLDVADEVMSRVVAVRNWGVSGGAARLGLTHGALSKFLQRRKIPT